ncbi:MAG TPA: hypothetical protein VGI30_04000 [Caulobacteraceae bacterium]
MTIVFLHVPKTAGTSLANMLAAHFAPERIYLPEPYGELSSRSADELAAFDFIYGHFDWSQLEAIPGPKKIVSLLREPVSRALSLYWYWRSYTWSEAEKLGSRGIAYAKRLSADEFFAGAPPDVSGNYENVAARQLVGSQYWDPRGNGFTIPNRDVIRICRGHIDEMTFCGTTEDFDASAAAVLKRLGLPFTASRRENVLSVMMHQPAFEPVQPTAPSPELVARLGQLAAIDAELHRYVRRGWPMRRAVLGERIRKMAGRARQRPSSRPSA